MNVKYALLNTNSKAPTKANDGDACFDLYASSVSPGRYYVEYGTGIAFDIPEGHCILVFPRSSVTNLGIQMANSVGVVDEGYTGEVKVRFTKSEDGNYYKIGERIAQFMLVPLPKVKLEAVEKIEKQTTRGAGGYGSSGK